MEKQNIKACSISESQKWRNKLTKVKNLAAAD